jgi:hypothetical protein
LLPMTANGPGFAKVGKSVFLSLAWPACPASGGITLFYNGQITEVD